MNLDHPCKQTCSGWMHGFEAGQEDLAADIAQLKAEVERLKNPPSLPCCERCLKNAAPILKLHADLAKAVAALARAGGMAGDPDPLRGCQNIAKMVSAVLAELNSNQTKGEK